MNIHRFLKFSVLILVCVGMMSACDTKTSIELPEQTQIAVNAQSETNSDFQSEINADLLSETVTGTDSETSADMSSEENFDTFLANRSHEIDFTTLQKLISYFPSQEEAEAILQKEIEKHPDMIAPIDSEIPETPEIHEGEFILEDDSYLESDGYLLSYCHNERDDTIWTLYTDQDGRDYLINTFYYEYDKDNQLIFMEEKDYPMDGEREGYSCRQEYYTFDEKGRVVEASIGWQQLDCPEYLYNYYQKYDSYCYLEYENGDYLQFSYGIEGYDGKIGDAVIEPAACYYVGDCSYDLGIVREVEWYPDGRPHRYILTYDEGGELFEFAEDGTLISRTSK